MNRRKNDRHRIRNIVVSSSKNDDDDSFTIYLFIVMCLSSRKWKRKTKKCRETEYYSYWIWIWGFSRTLWAAMKCNFERSECKLVVDYRIFLGFDKVNLSRYFIALILCSKPLYRHWHVYASHVDAIVNKIFVTRVRAIRLRKTPILRCSWSCTPSRRRRPIWVII